MPFLSESKRVNINAVIHAYRSGSLIPKPGDITYWYAGIQKEDPGPPGQRDEALARWTKEHGEGSMWIESVSVFFFFFFFPFVASRYVPLKKGTQLNDKLTTYRSYQCTTVARKWHHYLSIYPPLPQVPNFNSWRLGTFPYGQTDL